MVNVNESSDEPDPPLILTLEDRYRAGETVIKVFSALVKLIRPKLYITITLISLSFTVVNVH